MGTSFRVDGPDGTFITKNTGYDSWHIYKMIGPDTLNYQDWTNNRDDAVRLCRVYANAVIDDNDYEAHHASRKGF